MFFSIKGTGGSHRLCKGGLERKGVCQGHILSISAAHSLQGHPGKKKKKKEIDVIGICNSIPKLKQGLEKLQLFGPNLSLSR